MTLNPRLYIENAFNSFGSPGRDIPFSLYDRNIAFGGSACSFKKFIELISFSVLDVPNSISLKPRLLFIQNKRMRYIHSCYLSSCH